MPADPMDPLAHPFAFTFVSVFGTPPPRLRMPPLRARPAEPECVELHPSEWTRLDGEGA